ncbi:hypothetical protein POJ06DRAFT_138211 [Lipomyces tetrasporus]|uniref:NAD(P)-binding domain-containing protein n=1 Tax=Lipomyces tetrasporus TaxID=54092 RepID=A0AAD7QNQ0_9ASCO|nr:uncharacterized protein POJ06DRAFT_138211 [Lipomyces tetrasporus]KAJ8098638.1 hypothetical protein POJ06DRAFT_138211 [Lipomyces tetrasporus]
MANPSSILVLGGTGPLGVVTVRLALEHGHNVTVFARNPSKLPVDLRSSSNLTIVEGQLSDTANLFKLVDSCNAIISLLGPNQLWHKTGVFQGFYRNLLEHLQSLESPPRTLLISTISAPSPLDKFHLLAWLIVTAVYILAHGAYNDVVGVAETVEKNIGNLPITVFRVGGLLNGEGTGQPVATYVGHSDYTLSMNRKDIARWCVAQIESGDTTWIGKFPCLSAPAVDKKTR